MNAIDAPERIWAGEDAIFTRRWREDDQNGGTEYIRADLASPQPANPAQVTDASDGFSQYRRKQIAELRPWVSGDDMSRVSVSAPDKEAGSPKAGDMIARNPKNHDDQWLVAAAYFADNFEPITAAIGADSTKPSLLDRERAAMDVTQRRAIEGERISDAVLAWMVKYDLLDAGNEYHVSDVLAVLDDLAPSDRSAAIGAGGQAVADEVISEVRELDRREAFKAGWWTNAAYDQPSGYLEGCEDTDFAEYKKKGLDAYVTDLLTAAREASDAALSQPHPADERVVEAMRAQLAKATDPEYLATAMEKVGVCDVARAIDAENDRDRLSAELEEARKREGLARTVIGDLLADHTPVGLRGIQALNRAVAFLASKEASHD